MNPSGFSISDYHDIKPIYKKLDHLVSLPLQQIEARGNGKLYGLLQNQVHKIESNL
jgi:hypothetical protein